MYIGQPQKSFFLMAVPLRREGGGAVKGGHYGEKSKVIKLEGVAKWQISLANQ